MASDQIQMLHGCLFSSARDLSLLVRVACALCLRSKSLKVINDLLSLSYYRQMSLGRLSIGYPSD